ncbi:MAG: DeoR/GlpR family DNA-binding transcription regulator [Anaerolineae bacterium]
MSEQPDGSDGDGLVRNTSDRRWEILQELQRNQRLSIAELSQMFGVSAVSIRRDVAHLEGRGLLQRVRGGAQVSARRGQTCLFEARLLQNVAIKRTIGRAAAQLVHPGDTILVDAGTTVLEVVRHLPREVLDAGGLTVVTRSLVAAAELRSRRQVRLVLLGGVYVQDFDAFIGFQVDKALRNMHVNTLFIGTDGFTADRGLATDNLVEMGLYEEMARCADRVVVVADSSKIGTHRLQSVLPLSAVHTLVTDSGAPQEFVDTLREQGIEVLVAPGEAGGPQQPRVARRARS